MGRRVFQECDKRWGDDSMVIMNNCDKTNVMCVSIYVMNVSNVCV